MLQSIGLGNGSDWNEKGESWLQELKNKLHLFVKELVWKSADNLQGQFSLGSQLLSSDLTASASATEPPLGSQDFRGSSWRELRRAEWVGVEKIWERLISSQMYSFLETFFSITSKHTVRLQELYRKLTSLRFSS